MYRSIAAAVALGCAALAVPAHAKEEIVRVQGQVSRAGLDLSAPSDAAEFNRRVARAARHICRRGVPKDYQYGRVVNECRASVMDNGRQLLTSLVEKGQAGHRMARGR